ncbi:DnaJ protein,putative [Plasmodium gaboni]|uniref:DnaJ protein,putative n=1 Tax=Plasmodium gaboni TaxID=647221 RepID=A0ABY0KXI3_9APIC|nr:DnaJ protein,putative [Plasmodium gaboni]
MLSLETINTNINETTLKRKIHHIGKKLVMKTNMKEMIMKKKKKKNHFDKRKKTKVSSPNNIYEHPDTTYYDILNVNKNTRNDEPKIKFEKISEAYQILNDKEKRAEYDSIGMQCVDDVTLIDPSLLFMMLFSSEKLCDYIGVYDLTYMFNFIMRSMNKGHVNGIIFNMFGFMNKFFDKFKKDQENREFDLAVSLKYILQKYIDNGK